MVNPYHNSPLKRFFDFTLSSFGLIFLSPIYLLIFILLKLINHGPVFFVQERSGKDGKTFKMIKFRTMVVGSHLRQSEFKNLNEADGPVFKIQNDPRFTKFGKVLAHTGLDELPQLVNILRGEMSIVGPRPLPISEAKKIPQKYIARQLIKPGATSSWVINGSHKLTFQKWMELDLEYVKKADIRTDLHIFINTFGAIMKNLLEKILRLRIQ